MPATPLKSYYFGIIDITEARPLASATVDVYVVDTLNPVTLYADEHGLKTLANPITGNPIRFFAEQSSVDVRVVSGAYIYNIPDVLPTDHLYQFMVKPDSFDMPLIGVPDVLPSYTLAGLPAAGTAGRLARVTDDIRGPHMDNGSRWFQLYGSVVNALEFDLDLQVAINAATSTGTRPGAVWLPPNQTVTASAGLTLYSDLAIIGAGRTSIVKLDDSVNANLFTATSRDRIILANFRIDGNKTNNTGSLSAIRFTTVTDSLIDALEIFDAQDKAINLNGCTDCIVRGNRIRAPEVHGIVLDNASLRNLIEGNRISDPSTSSGFGIYVFASSRNTIRGNVCSSGVIGIAVEGDGGGAVDAAFNIVDANICTAQSGGSSQAAIHFEDRTPHCVITNNIAEGNTGTNGHGILVLAPTSPVLRGLVIKGNVCRDNNGSGIRVNDLRDSVVEGNVCSNNDAFGGISLVGNVGFGCQNILVKSNRCFDDRGPAVQPYGIAIEDATAQNLTIVGNDVRGNLTAGILTGGGATLAHRIHDNIGFLTENRGTSSIVSGTTSIAVTHGLAVTPDVEDITINFTESPTSDPGNVWITSITSTQFTVNVRNDPGASNLDFTWAVRVKKNGAAAFS